MTETPELKKPLSERPLGYVVAVVGGVLGAPLGLVTSPVVLFLLNKGMKGKEGKQPNRLLTWALIGIVGAPISLAIGNPGFNKGFSDGYNQSRTTKQPTETESKTKPESNEPPKDSWNSEEKKKQLEKGIKENFALAVTGAQQNVATVSCEATSTKMIWNCNIRMLGEETANPWRIEVDEKGTWAGKPITSQN